MTCIDLCCVSLLCVLFVVVCRLALICVLHWFVLRLVALCVVCCGLSSCVAFGCFVCCVWFFVLRWFVRCVDLCCVVLLSWRVVIAYIDFCCVSLICATVSSNNTNGNSNSTCTSFFMSCIDSLICVCVCVCVLLVDLWPTLTYVAFRWFVCCVVLPAWRVVSDLCCSRERFQGSVAS